MAYSKKLAANYFYDLYRDESVGSKRFFNATEVTVYINNFALSDLVSIQYSVDQNVMPIFGYNSYVSDIVSVGSRLISGAFMIYKTSADQMLDLLRLADVSDETVHSKNKPLYGSAFNISIMLDINETFTIEGCNISKVKEIVNNTGDVLAVVYEFMAQDISTLGKSSYNAPVAKSPITADYIEVLSGNRDETSVSLSLKREAIDDFVPIIMEASIQFNSNSVKTPFISCSINDLEITTGTLPDYEIKLLKEVTGILNGTVRLKLQIANNSTDILCKQFRI